MTMTWIILKGQLKGQGVLHICKIWKVKSAILYLFVRGSIVVGVKSRVLPFNQTPSEKIETVYEECSLFGQHHMGK